jgi:hypothetical protein
VRQTLRKLPKAKPRSAAKIVPRMRIMCEVEYTLGHLRWGQLLALRSLEVRSIPCPQVRGTRGTRGWRAMKMWRLCGSG